MEFFDDECKESVVDYHGPERRKIHRRQTADRREGVRFEVDNPPRRSGLDRRSHDYLWNTPQTL